MRRRDGWFDRKTLFWSMLSINIAMRDIQRELFAAFGGRGRPDLRPFWRTIDRIGAVYLVLAIVVILLLVAARLYEGMG